MSELIAPALAYPFEEKRLKKGIWVAEQKWDGHRMLACTVGGDAPICWSRGLKVMRNVPEHIRAALREMPPCILDGELVQMGNDGKSYGVSHARADVVSAAELRYVIFDILNLRGVDLCGLPLKDRWDRVLEVAAHLYVLDGDTGPIGLSMKLGPVSCADDALKVASIVWEYGGEGLVIKESNGVYRPGKRMQTWMKLKRLETAVLTVVGFEDGLMGPRSIAVLEDDAGVRTTVKWKNHAWLFDVIKNGDAYVEAKRRVRIEFTERTAGSYREPRWDRWEDE